jgi:polysaccharide chain length determinant protein (PEP-CTERM system associated)
VNMTSEFDISKILGSFYRQKTLIISVFLVVSCLTLYLASILPEVYRSTTLILVTPQRVPTSFVTSTVTTALTERIQSMMQEILSRTQLEKIVQEFNLYPGGKGSMMEDRVQALRRNIVIDFRRSNVFSLSYDSEIPEKAKQIAGRVASLFIEQNLQVREQQALGTTSFINAEAERLRKELEDQEAAVNRFRALNRFELPDQLDPNLRTLEQLRTELQTSLARLASLQERKGSLEKQVVEAEIAGPEISSARGVSKAPSSAPSDVLIQTRRRELEALLRQYSAKHPDVIRVKNEIAAAEAELKAQKTAPDGSRDFESSMGSPLAQLLKKQITGLDSEILALRSQIEGVRRQVALYQTRIDDTPVRGIELSKISRTYEITLKKYQDLLAKGLESELSENLEKKQKGEQFQIVDPANFPLKPIRPDRQKIVLFGLLGGLAAGFGLAFLWDNLDSTFKRGDEVNSFVNIPLLATIPGLLTRGSILDQRRTQGLIVLTSVATLAVGLVCVRFFGPMYF